MAKPDGLVDLGRDTWVRGGLIVAVTGRPIYHQDHYALPAYAGADVRATVLLAGGGFVPAYDDAATVVKRWRAALGREADGV